MVDVWDTKEKGSDVNLAAYLLFDGFNKEYEMAVVVSNDADLVEPIRLVTREMHLPVGIWHPHSNHVWELDKVATFYRRIHRKALRLSQFPPVIRDSQGRTISKPSSW